MNRRRLLCAAPALIGLADAGLDAAAAAPNPDADLLAACAEFNACDLQQHAIYDGPNAMEDDGGAAVAAAPIFTRMGALLDCMEHLRAVSPAGIAARAGSLAQHSGEGAFSFDERSTTTGRLLDYLMRDAAALGRAGPAAAVLTGSGIGSIVAAHAAQHDAELIALCAVIVTGHAEMDRYGDLYPEREPPHVAARIRVLVNEGHRLSEQVADMRATTPEGLRAKAEALWCYACPGNDNPGTAAALCWSSHDELLGWSIARDLLGRTVT